MTHRGEGTMWSGTDGDGDTGGTGEGGTGEGGTGGTGEGDTGGTGGTGTGNTGTGGTGTGGTGTGNTGGIGGTRRPSGGADVGVPPGGFRAPPSTRVGRVRLQVADLERSLAWYSDLLGFRVLERARGSVALGAHGDEAVPLVELVERPGARPVPPQGRLGLFHVAFLLPDRASLGRILAYLAESGARIGSADHLVSEALYLNDPDGLGLEIYADRPRTAWRANGREIAMATEPLATRDLIAAGGSEPWSGIPAGTRVGHIHVSVDDLAAAERFFHVALGLDKIVWSYPGALFLSAGGYHHHVGANTWARGAHAAGEGDARLLEWRLVYPDADAVSAALQSAADAGFASAVDRTGHRITDPWGTVVRLATHA